MDPLNSPDNNYQNIPDFPPVADPNAPHPPPGIAPPGIPPPPPPGQDMLQSAPIAPPVENGKSAEPGKSSEPANDSNPSEDSKKKKKNSKAAAGKGKKSGGGGATRLKQRKLFAKYRRMSVFYWTSMALFAVLVAIYGLIALHYMESISFIPFLSPP